MSNDYTSNILMNLQQRITYAEGAIGFLTSEVQRLSHGAPSNPQGFQPPSQGFQTAIPLQPAQPARRAYPPRTNAPNDPQGSSALVRSNDSAPPAIIALSEILNTGEVVIFGINTGRDAQSNWTQSTVHATFDGTDLTVTECSTIASLVGLKTAKPGDILFKFMTGLKNAGLLQRTFSALPWRLAYVQRGGERFTLAQLRRSKLNGGNVEESADE
jgi:hypothetical protein